MQSKRIILNINVKCTRPRMTIKRIYTILKSSSDIKSFKDLKAEVREQ